MSERTSPPKYINSPESSIYQKNASFFGLHLAYDTIRKTNMAYLVEGNPDVIRLHEKGVHNSIAPLGTSLTPNHVLWLKSNCNRVTLIGDSDAAGKSAVERNAELLIKSGLFVNVIMLPDDQKEDPDSFFADVDFLEYESDNTRDYIVWYVTTKSGSSSRPDIKHEIVGRVSKMIYSLPHSSNELYIEQVSKFIKPKKAWTDELKILGQLDSSSETDKQKHAVVPKHVDANTFEEYRFYEDDNRYFFRTSRGFIIRGSNFVMKPLFHVESVADSKRLFEITNEFNYTRVIELAQRDLISLGAFKLRVESIGNFLWEAGETELNLLKRYIYEKTSTCTEIKQLGWQKEGFWAWSNGIYNGSFTPTDDFGIAQHHKSNYYIPAFSKIFEGEHSLFVSERRFIHNPSNISMFDVVKDLETVFGPNAQICFGFLIATLFRDIITSRFGFFPILNLFGPKGAGKTEMAVCMLLFFGKQARGPNINNTSKPALADHVAQHSNALCHIDEYKNSMEMEKHEFLKGLWDGTGRTRMNMEKDKKKEMTPVDAGIVLTGQEMPTLDIALFSRLIFLTFTQDTFNDVEKARFNKLKDSLRGGITHITHELLQHRTYFSEFYWINYDKVCEEFNHLLDDEVIEDRTYRNWAVVIAAFRTLQDKINTHIDYEELLNLAVGLIIRQNTETKRTNDVANFWDIFSYLVKEGEIVDQVDFKVVLKTDILKTDRHDFDFSEAPMHIIYINHTRIFQKYRKHGAQTRDAVLPIKTLDYYLGNSKEFYGKARSTSFIMKVGGESEPDIDNKVKRQITSAMVFNYEQISEHYDVNITLDEIDADDKRPF